MFDKSFDMEKLPPLNEQSNISLNKIAMYPLFECKMHKHCLRYAITYNTDLRLQFYIYK